MRCFKRLIISSVSIFFILISISYACSISLKPYAQVENGKVYLKDIAVKYPKQLQNLTVCIAPSLNGSIKIDKKYILKLLKKRVSESDICGESTIVKRKKFYITKSMIENLTHIKNIKFMTKMPIAMPYSKYEFRIANIVRSKHSIWINVKVLRNKQFYRNIGISGKIIKLTLFPVARYDIRRGHTITQNDIKFIKVNRIPSVAIQSDRAIVGYSAASDIKQNGFFTPSNTKQKKLVKRGDIITVMVVNNSIKISTVAKALRGGYKEDIIPIMYLSSKRVADGVIISNKKVLVQ